MATVNGLLIDIDGVILRDESVLPGAVELVAWLLEIEARFLFVTNYPSQTPADLAGRRWRNAFTGAELTATPRDGIDTLPLAQVLDPCPVALLLGI